MFCLFVKDQLQSIMQTPVYSCLLCAACCTQMRHNPHVQADEQLKELLLDAYSRRCLATAQQPAYHMAPLPGAWEPRAQPDGLAAAQAEAPMQAPAGAPAAAPAAARAGPGVWPGQGAAAAAAAEVDNHHANGGGPLADLRPRGLRMVPPGYRPHAPGVMDFAAILAYDRGIDRAHEERVPLPAPERRLAADIGLHNPWA